MVEGAGIITDAEEKGDTAQERNDRRDSQHTKAPHADMHA